MQTNFAALQPEQKTVWARDVWSGARDQMFHTRFTGTSPNNVIQRITALTKTERGTRAILTLVADLAGDGVTGDNEREGNEESMQSYHEDIEIDQMSHGVINKGKLADQASVVNFREQGRDKLSFWIANRCDQLCFLAMAGVSFEFHNNGARRVGSAFPSLNFAKDVAAPTPKRALMWDGGTLVQSDTTLITPAMTPAYAMIVDLIAYAHEHYIKPLMAGGQQYFVIFMHTTTLAMLKKSQDYQAAIIRAMPSGAKNPWFTGATVTVDGAVIHPHRLTYNTKGADPGDKWGAGGNVDGTRTMLAGCQALGSVDLGTPDWDEKTFDYKNKQGINVDKRWGIKKPQYHSLYDQSVEDFGIVTCDHWIQ